MRHDRRLAPFLTLFFLALPLAVHAAPQIFTPTVQQCDGSYAAGSGTRLGAPLVQVGEQDTDAVGLKTGQQNSDFYSTQRLGLRSADMYRVESSSCSTTGGVARETYAWYYADTASTATAPDKGLLGAYFGNIDFSNLKVLRIDATVDQTPGTGAPDPSMGPNQYSQRWTGYVLPPITDDYTFQTTASDGQRLYVSTGGNFVTYIDSWTDQVSQPNPSPASIHLTGGQPYEIAFEHYENSSAVNPGNAHLQWKGTTGAGGGIGTSFVAIASQFLRPSMVPMIGRCSYKNSTTANCVAPLALDGGNDANGVPLSRNPPSNLGFTCPASTFTAPGVPSINTGTFNIPSVAAPFDGANKAFTFDGAKNFAALDVGGQWYVPPSYTISAWIKKPVGTLAGAQRIVSQQSGNFWFFRLNGGQIDAEDSRDGASKPGANGTAIPDDGNWHFVAAVRANGVSWKYFIDGVNVYTTTSISTSTQIMGLTSADNGAARAYIGAFEGPAAPAGGGEWFNGTIDELRIYPGQIFDDTLLMEYSANAYRYSNNGGTSFGVSTSPYSGGAPPNGTKNLVTLLPAPLATSNSRFIFIAQGADGLATATAPTFPVSIDNSPPAAPSLTANPTATNSITWNFSTSKVCNDAVNNKFLLYQSSTSLTVAVGTTAINGTSFAETYPGFPPNSIFCRQGDAVDVWGYSALGPPTTAYTLAASPTGLTVTASRQTDIALQWNANGNPTYTRYVLSMSQNGFVAPPDVSTPVPLSANFTGTTYDVTGLTPGSPYFFQVSAVNGQASDAFGGIFSINFSQTSSFTAPTGAVVTAIPKSNTQIDWHWKEIKGATSYNLYSAASPTPFANKPSGGPPGNDIFYSSTGLITNNLYGFAVQPINVGNGPISPATSAYTLALPPSTLSVTGVSTNSVSLLWDAGAAPPLNNPAYTTYEVAVATDPLFAVVVATQTTQQLSLKVGGLFPSSTYYARVRAFNAQQSTTTFQPGLPPAVQVTTVTDTNPDITLSSGTPSAYVPPGGVIGLWQFDESTGTVSRDQTAFGNNGTMTCLLNGCVSTPTYTAGPTGLGTAASFTGQTGSLILISSAAQYEVTDAISVGAWTNPATIALPNGAAIVAKGPFGAESFSLDVWGGRYRFLVNGMSVTSPTPIDVGHWHRVLGTYDGFSANLYIDGQLAAGPLAVAQPLTTIQCAGFACPLVIGNRKSVTTAYDLGFSGGIDSALLVHRGLSAAEAVADYQGAFPITTTLPPPNNRIQITLSPNAFGAPAQIYASNDPIGHPLKVSFVALTNGLLNVPTGHTLVTGSLIEIVPTVGGVPFTQPLGSSATLTLPYNNVNGNGIIDGSNPPISVNTLQVYTLDTTIGQWNYLPTSIDTSNKVVNATTPHFSVFALFGATTIGAGLSQARVYPKPWIIGSAGRFAAPTLSFDKLPANGLIRIFGLSGERVIELDFTSNNAGKVSWDGNNFNGAPVASGVYFAYIKDADSQATAVVKFAIER